ncbi:MAG: FoF1 ATP synthase subunit a, partial [Candidatus Omnitrophota bacterium]
MAEKNIPELANLITLIYEKWGASNPLIAGFYRWENLVYAVLAGAGLIILFSVGFRRRKLIPEKLQNVLEFIVESVNDFVAATLGHYSARFVPFLGTLFLYILCMNLMVLVPGMKSPTSDLNVTVSLALVVFVYVQYTALRELGLKGMVQHLCGGLLKKPSGPADFIVLLIVPLIFFI